MKRILTGMTPQEFQRKHHKQKLAMFVSKFNKKPKHLLVYVVFERTVGLWRSLETAKSFD